MQDQFLCHQRVGGFYGGPLPKAFVKGERREGHAEGRKVARLYFWEVQLKVIGCLSLSEEALELAKNHKTKKIFNSRPILFDFLFGE